MEFCFKFICTLLIVDVVFYTCTSCTPASTAELSNNVDTKNVTEGNNLTVVCNATGTRIYWTKDYQPFRFERMLNIPYVKRNFTGLYTCYASNISDTESVDEHNIGEEIYSFFLDVLYPAKIISVNVSKTTLHVNDEFVMQVKVEGNPIPTTTFKSLTDDTTWYNETTEDGKYTIRIPMVNCIETGNYELTCENSLGNDATRENIYVLCAPETDPRFPLNSTVKAHSGGIINLTVHVIGYPRAAYQWWHDGTQLFNHTDAEYTTMLILHDIQFEYFGGYELVMKNAAGNNSVLFDVQAEGPPDSAYDLEVSDVTTDTANISFITGYDYNAMQSFYIMREVAGKLTDFHRKVNDTPNDHGGREVSVVIGDLQESTAYNLVVRSGNSRGNSSDVSNNIFFLTYGKPEPDPEFHTNTTFKPRLGDSVTLTAHAKGLPIPTFQWKHNGNLVNSTAHNYTSIVVITEVVFDNFGGYTLNVTNKYGTYSEDYEVLAEEQKKTQPSYSRDITLYAVTMLSSSDATEDSVKLKWKAGFDYGSKQSFEIKGTVNDNDLKNMNDISDTSGGIGGIETAKLENLDSSSSYKIYLVAKNVRGSATSESNTVSFTTKGGSNKRKSKITADYVGYVMGGIGAVLLIIVIISVIRRCLKRRKEVPYEMFPER